MKEKNRWVLCDDPSRLHVLPRYFNEIHLFGKTYILLIQPITIYQMDYLVKLYANQPNPLEPPTNPINQTQRIEPILTHFLTFILKLNY